MTKLFQNNDVTLRRMCYLTIKELSKMTEHAFIMTQSLSKVHSLHLYLGSILIVFCELEPDHTVSVSREHHVINFGYGLLKSIRLKVNKSLNK